MDKLILGDCLEELRRLPSGAADVVITDPPYGLGIKYTGYNDSQENLVALLPFVEESRRIAKLTVIFCGVNNVQIYPKADWTACWFYGTTGNFGKFGFNAWQPILLYGKNNRRYGMDTIKYSKIEKRYPGHPCSKPVGLMQMVVERFSEPGDTILDPFLGTGSTAIAAKTTGRHYIGIEREPEYLEIARKRLQGVAHEQPAAAQLGLPKMGSRASA